MRYRTIAPIVVALALLTAACSGSDDDPSVATLGDGEASASASSSAEPDLEESLLAFAECMREEGVEVSDPQVDEDGRIQLGPGSADIDPNDPDVQAALEACQDELPEFGEGIEIDPDLEAQFQDAQLEFARCMRDEGIDVPDPTGDGFVIGPGSDIDPSDPDVQAAIEVCRPILEEVFGPPVGEG